MDRLIVIQASHGIIINKLLMHTINWMIINVIMMNGRNQTKNVCVLYNSTYILQFQKLQTNLYWQEANLYMPGNQVWRDEKKNYTGAQWNIGGNSYVHGLNCCSGLWMYTHVKTYQYCTSEFLKNLTLFPQYFDILVPSLSSFHRSLENYFFRKIFLLPEV